MKVFSPSDIINAGLCIGCGNCVAQSGGTSMEFDAYGELKPAGSTQWLNAATAEFSSTCPFSPVAANESQLAEELFMRGNQAGAVHPVEKAYAGYVAEQDFRMQGSSGGMVSWMASELMNSGLVDGIVHVVAVDGSSNNGRFFKYTISKTIKEIRLGAKSRYYPIEMSEVLKLIQESPGRYAVIGIPCFIKAVQLLRKTSLVLQERIQFTLGLFCGHMKSARFVESFALQMKVPIDQVQEIEFRVKNEHRPANVYTASIKKKDGIVITQDWWNMGDGDWGAGFFMNNACNFCDDVIAETADISFGDAWVEPYSSDGRGNNVIVVRSQLIQEIIDAAIFNERLQLKEVDANFVEQTQAAGFRQRREGLAYRLSWATKKIQPLKRVRPLSTSLNKNRKIIYQLRYYISKWSHLVFRLSKKINQPWVYIFWARFTASIYHGFAYHKGSYREMLKRWRSFKY
jgi:coenzyme F420-reducing hydrogenase beta subunit